MKIKKRKKAEKREIDLFIDSGAFSADSQGIEINIDEYIAFLKENASIINAYACLDVIGDPEGTYRNQLYMEKQGLMPIIAFHKGEDYKWLHKYVEKYDYIALGGMAGGIDVSPDGLAKHLDRCFDIVCDTPDRLPRCRVHGFGVNSLRMMFRYPWYSVDSTGWIKSTAMGFILLPRVKRGKEDWRRQLKVYCSKRNIQTNNNYIFNLSLETRNYVLDYIKRQGFVLGDSEIVEVGKDYELQENEIWAKKGKAVERIAELGLSNSNRVREDFIVKYYCDLEGHFPEYPFPFERKSLKGFF